ncbi:hypothetical protein M2263_000820 [Providencia alcalifaciens]|nr:hypothetical protein [Providencia alcalifaciens]
MKLITINLGILMMGAYFSNETDRQSYSHLIIRGNTVYEFLPLFTKTN